MKGGLMLKWKRVQPGLQVSTCGRYAVVCDGYERSQSAGRDPGYDRHNPGTHNLYEGFVGGEWAAVLTKTDENMDWKPTMREAKEVCESHAVREARVSA
jgi:hypothetical protein